MESNGAFVFLPSAILPHPRYREQTRPVIFARQAAQGGPGWPLSASPDRSPVWTVEARTGRFWPAVYCFLHEGRPQVFTISRSRSRLGAIGRPQTAQGMGRSLPALSMTTSFSALRFQSSNPPGLGRVHTAAGQLLEGPRPRFDIGPE